MALGSVDIGVNPKSQRFVDEQLIGVEVAHEVGQGMALVWGHPAKSARSSSS